jgi:hypothetical protein
MLAIASFIIHYLAWQAARGLGNYSLKWIAAAKCAIDAQTLGHFSFLIPFWALSIGFLRVARLTGIRKV